MDVTQYLELKIAPRAIFDRLEERRERPRYVVPRGDGTSRVVTWGEHAKEIRELALFLASSELGAGDRAAIFATNRVEWMSAAMAIQAAGGVMVPVYPSSTAEQAAYVVRHSDAKVHFVDGAALLERIFERWSEMDAVTHVVWMGDEAEPARVLASMGEKGLATPSDADVTRRVVRWSGAIAAGRARDVEDPGAFERTMHAVSLDQPGMMLYTSGTSGPPKGVPLTHRNVGVNGRDWLQCNAPLLREGAVDLLWLPMSHIFGFGEACLGNSLGWTSHLAEPATVLQRLPQVRPEVFMSVPSVWEKIAMGAMARSERDAQREALRAVTGGELRFCLSGGAGLKREVKELLHSHGLLIIEGYGLTEASPTLTLNRPDAFRFDSVGKPVPSVEVKLADDGEILARGDSIFGGYHKDPAASAEAFTEDGWLKTGDIGRFTEDGFLQIVDRKKDILVTAGGKNVPPINIEQRFADDPSIAHVVVYGDGKKYLVAGVWVNGEVTEADVHASVERVNAQLASYESIKKFVIVREPLTVEDGLLTPTLKVKRKKVYETFRDRFEALYA